MSSHRTNVVLPLDLVTEIDALVGPRGRRAFLVDTARAELRRRRLLDFLSSEHPAWRDGDHPELEQGTDAWVKSLRSETDRPESGSRNV